ncbi:hypothetical protein [Cellulomonas soli]|nr:hypothetical protein [Cellulomonas soli]NYI59156.1 hypothetical protein [Cellulomonas soli]
MEPHLDIAPDGTRLPLRHVHLTVTEAEGTALAGLLERAVRDADPDDDAGVVDAVEGAGRLLDVLDAQVRAPVQIGLPEHDVVRLPRTGVTLCGPGVQTAVAIHGALIADGRSEQEAWEAAGREVGSELAQAVLAGVRGVTCRPLARVYRAVLREAAAHRD